MSLLRRPNDRGYEELRPSVRVAGYIAVLAAAVTYVLVALHYEPPPEAEPAAVANVGDIEAPCGGINDCNGDGIPDDVEADIEREHRAELAETYCEGAGSDYEGGSEACFEGVMDGSIEVDPVGVYGPPEGGTVQDYYPEPSYP